MLAGALIAANWGGISYIFVLIKDALIEFAKATGEKVGEIAKYLSEKTKQFLTQDYKGMIENIKTIPDKKEILTNLKVKAEVIKLPSIITKISKFSDEDEVLINVEKGKIEIKEHKFEKPKSKIKE